MFSLFQRYLNPDQDQAADVLPVHTIMNKYREVSRLNEEDASSSYVARSFQGLLLHELMITKNLYGEQKTLQVRGSIESLILEPADSSEQGSDSTMEKAEFERFKEDLTNHHPHLTHESRIAACVMHILFHPSHMKNRKGYITFGRERERDRNRVKEVVSEMGQFCVSLSIDNLNARQAQVHTLMNDGDSDSWKEHLKKIFAQIEVCSLKDVPGLIVVYRRTVPEKDKRPPNRD